MKLGELRERLRDVPDDAELLVDGEGDLRFAELTLRWFLAPVLDHPYAVLFETGQVWNYELDLDARIDAKLDL